MLKRMSHITVFVPNQEEALQFYRDKLELQVHTDKKFGGSRWLTLCSKEDPEFEICLMPGIPFTQNDSEEEALLGVFITDDCRKTFQVLTEKGVEFVGEPKTEPWGTGVTFKDPFGNPFYINQLPFSE